MTAAEFVVTEGVILSRREISDDTVRLDCYTLRFGRLTGYFRRARWEKVFAAAPGSIGELTIRDPRGSAPLIAGCDRQTLLYHEGMNPSSYWGILTVLEALHRLLPQREPDAPLYRSALGTLTVLARGGRPAPTVIAFLLRLLDITGHRWRLDCCRACGRVENGGMTLVPGDGSLLCGRCRSGGPGGIALSRASVVALNHLSSLPPERAATVVLHREVTIEALRALALGIPFHFDRQLNGLAAFGAPLPPQRGG